ncbi:MAG: type II toxin-antitoxin system RelE/ParE family toxin [Candidatus Binatia bacterium]
MIQSFRHKGLSRLFVDGDRKRLPADMIEKIENILAVLSRAKVPSDLNLPGFRLHPLKGRLKGFWSVTVRANWRVIFRFRDGHVWDVDLIDYH